MSLPPPGPGTQDLIAGFCRFSYLGDSDFSAMRMRRGGPEPSEADWRARAALLYSDARLEARFASFEVVCLPSILAQDDPRFRFFVITSPELPARWRDRLAAACAVSDTIRVKTVPERRLADGLAPILRRLTQRAGRNLIQFRLDDDDGLAKGAIARLRELADRMAGVEQFGISIARGLQVGIYPGQPVVPLQDERPFLGASTAVRMADPQSSVFALDHVRIARRMTHLVDREVTGSVALKWPSDSRPLDFDKLPAGARRMAEDEFRGALRRWFPWLADLDFDGFRRIVEASHAALTAPAGQGIHR